MIGTRGFNLVELLMSLSMATILFMSITVLFVKQSEVMQAQNDVIDVGREAQFAVDHLRRDLTSLGSNTTPNSDIDPTVCEKPLTSLRALSVSVENGDVVRPDLNPFTQPVALTLFGSLDVKQRFRSASISGDKVFLVDDGKLPVSQPAFDDVFATDRYLRISDSDGTQFFFVIASASFAERSVSVTQSIPRQGEGQSCGYQGFGQNYMIDVQNFVRYRVAKDVRPGAPVDKNGLPTQTLLLRERMGADGTTLRKQLVLAENAVDFGIVDIAMDNEPAANRVLLHGYTTADEVAQKGGGGILGTGAEARPETLRFLTVKLSLRSAWPDARLAHAPRDGENKPLLTFRIADDEVGAHVVTTVATRVSMPTLVSRNL